MTSQTSSSSSTSFSAASSSSSSSASVTTFTPAWSHVLTLPTRPKELPVKIEGPLLRAFLSRLSEAVDKKDPDILKEVYRVLIGIVERKKTKKQLIQEQKDKDFKEETEGKESKLVHSFSSLDPRLIAHEVSWEYVCGRVWWASSFSLPVFVCVCPCD